MRRSRLFGQKLLVVSVCAVLSVTGAVAQSLTWLGTLGGSWSEAHGVSADGSVVVGAAYNASNGDRAFRWTPSGGMDDLGTLGGNFSEARGVSADGSVVVGSAQNASAQNRAFRWTPSGGMQDLGTLGGDRSWAYDVSADGSVVVGWAQNASGRSRAFRWTPSGGMQDLGTLGGDSAARSVSADGRVVVGWAFNASGWERAFRWTPSGGMEDLNAIAIGLTAGSRLEVASGISPNGRYIVGSGFNAATDRYEAWIMDMVPEPASLLALGVGLAGVMVRRRRAA